MTITEHIITLHSLYRNIGRPLPLLNKKSIQKLVSSFQCRSEIIGTWVYCFASKETGLYLSAYGFWYSYKHGAFVYSGYPKGGPASEETLNEIRARLGNRRLT